MEETVFHEDKTFSNINYAETKLRDREFVHCTFLNCNFHKSDLSDNSFEDCVFQNCNFSMTILNGAGMRDVTFIECKVLGVDFTKCNKYMFSFSFTNSFFGLLHFLWPET